MAKEKTVEPQLPPPGDERREVLAQRKDELEERAEKLAAEQELSRISPKALEPDNDIQARLHLLQVSNAQPGKVYCWVKCVAQTYTPTGVQRKLADGWEVVCGNMPEAIECRQADGTRRIGDVLLMRIDQARHERLQEKERYKRLAQEEGVAAGLLEKSAELARAGYGENLVHVPENMDEGMMEQIVKKSAARQLATKAIDGMLRQGRMPGVPIRG